MDLNELEYQAAKMGFWERLLKEELKKMNPDQGRINQIEKRLAKIYNWFYNYC